MTSTEQEPGAKQEEGRRALVVGSSITGIKHSLYLSIAVFSFILFIVSCVVVTYERDTYGGYNPPAAELAFIAAFGALFLPLFVWAQRVRPDSTMNSLVADLAMCSFLWLFILGGVGGLAAQTYDLPACQNLFICRGFSTMMAFSWISWILISLPLGFIFMMIGALWSRKIPIKWMAPVKEVHATVKDKSIVGNAPGHTEEPTKPTEV